MKLRYLMLRHRINQKTERFNIWLSRRLPKNLRMWVYTCTFADVMSGAFPSKSLDEVSAMDVYGHVANLNF